MILIRNMLRVLKGVARRYDQDKEFTGRLETRITTTGEIHHGVMVFLTHEQASYIKFLIKQTELEINQPKGAVRNAQQNRSTTQHRGMGGSANSSSGAKPTVQAGDTRPVLPATNGHS